MSLICCRQNFHADFDCSNFGLVDKSCVENYTGTIFIAFLNLDIIVHLFIDCLDIVPMFFNLHFKQFTAARIFVWFLCFFSIQKYMKFFFFAFSGKSVSHSL